MAVMRTEGYAGLTTRRVAVVAEGPMSQIQYHFGSKEGMVLALFEHMNTQLLERQSTMFVDPTLTLSQQWNLACDYLDDDLASGYVSVLQELLSAGWTNDDIGAAVRAGLLGWIEVLTDLAGRALERGVPLGPLTAEDVAALVASSYIGAESLLLLGMEDQGVPVRKSLRRFGEVIRTWEESGR